MMSGRGATRGGPGGLSVEHPLKRSQLVFEVERHPGVVIVEKGKGE